MTTLEQHFKIADLAKKWGLCFDTVSDIFKDEPGVLVIDHPETRTKRSYCSMRIPLSVANRVYASYLSK